MKNGTILIAALAFFFLSAGEPVSPQEQYIATYAPIAVSEMYRTGVPASITLAQGLLESRYGLSSLAKDGNNHFGIKCHDWTGKKMFYDDDRKGECFRVYEDAGESFQDHSDFLRYRDRYKFLFEYSTTDYKSWAYGLKKAGYATDPSYPAKLIKYIEDYKLYEYDKMSVKQAEEVEAKYAKKREAEAKKAEKQAGKQASGKSSKTSSKQSSSKKSAKPRKRASDKTRYVDESLSVIPPSPMSIEEPKRISREGVNESFTVSLKLEMYSRNGVPFITAQDGQDVESIAKYYKLFSKELRRFNDVPDGWEPQPGDIVYLQKKKKQAARGLEKYIVDHEGENLWQISQRFGIRLKTLQKLNGFGPDHVLKEGDTVYMRQKPLIKRIFSK
ncbi:MAG: glucosaminidase domain-containing protein [Bacteroidales bacterium]|nr:glucosaminidase domain-containing protein [Bacteroidales bacterium]